MARSARAAMMALHLSGVVFQRKWSRLNSSRGRGRSQTRRKDYRSTRRWWPSDAPHGSDGDSEQRAAPARPRSRAAEREMPELLDNFTSPTSIC
jgi:hypothetical protein